MEVVLGIVVEMYLSLLWRMFLSFMWRLRGTFTAFCGERWPFLLTLMWNRYIAKFESFAHSARTIWSMANDKSI